MKFVTVNITDEDIREGQKTWRERGGISYSRAETCPLALALKREGLAATIVGDYIIFAHGTMPTGRTVRKFLKDADEWFRNMGGTTPPHDVWINRGPKRSLPQVQPRRLRVRIA